MITLEANNTLEMVTTTGSVVVCTVEGMELNTTTSIETYKVLGQTTVASGTGAAVYTSPANTSAFVKTILLCSSSLVAETVIIYVGGHAATNEIMTMVIPIGGSASFGADGWKIYDSDGIPSMFTNRGIQEFRIGGNTSGTTAVIQTGTMQLAGGSGVTLSQNAQTITISAADPFISYFDNMATAASNIAAVSFNSLHIFPINLKGFFPSFMRVSSWWFDMSCSVSSAAAAETLSSVQIIGRIGIYTANSDTLNLLNSVAKTIWSTANTFSVSSQLSLSFYGNRWLQFESSLWSTTPILDQSNYYIGLNFGVNSDGGTSNAVPNLTMNLYGQSWWNTMQRSGYVGTGSVANSTQLGQNPFLGELSVSTAGIPATIAMSDINKQSSNGNFIPHIILNNLTSNF